MRRIHVCSAAVATLAVGMLAPGLAQAQTGQTFYAVTPCRVVDTRTSVDPAVVKRGNFADDEVRAYTLSTSADCPGLPSTATAWSLNIQYRPLTVRPTSPPTPTASPARPSPPSSATPTPGSSTTPSSRRANGGTFDIYCQYAGRVIIDVNGYFAP